MERFSELTVQQANEETRPFKALAAYPGSEEFPASLVIEYLDVGPNLNAYEYTYTGGREKLADLQNDGWELYDMINNQFGKVFHLRRAKPVTESAADD